MCGGSLSCNITCGCPLLAWSNDLRGFGFDFCYGG